MTARLLTRVTWAVVAAVAASVFAPSLRAQTWSWPDSARNLKVLPANSDGKKLRAVMTGFTRALGVRCTHCHVGKDGEPLGTYDFASDANPKKGIARGMLNMLGSVNEQLRQIQPDVPDRVNMWCNTCHHGLPRPRTLVEEMTLVYDRTGADSTVVRYRTLRALHDNAGAYDFREPALNTLGYYALGKKDVAGAIALFRLNAEQFPKSSNVHDSLGEAYRAAGDKDKAIAEYERAIQLDPKNQDAKKALEELRQ